LADSLTRRQTTEFALPFEPAFSAALPQERFLF
jgi:hypothetical protein